MDQRTQDFIAMFQAFLDEVVQKHREQEQPDGERALAPLPQEHLGADPRTIAVGLHHHPLPPRRRRPGLTPASPGATLPRLSRRCVP